MSDAITRSTTATGEPHDPVAQLAHEVRRHIATDGEVPVREMCEIAVLDREINDNRTAAASLYLAHDAAAGGDQREAWRCVLATAHLLAGDDRDLQVIGVFYARAG